MVYQYPFCPAGTNESSVPWIGNLWFSSVHEKVVIYRARWKSHECPTRDLSIPEVEPYLCDENKIAPTKISSLYAFLTSAPSFNVHSAPCYLHFCALYETPGCTYRLIHVDKGFVCLNKSWVLSQNLSKNLQSHRRNRKMYIFLECHNIHWTWTRTDSSSTLQYSNDV